MSAARAIRLNLTPTVKFAIRLPYGTGTSPTLSLDGTVLYLFESRSSANGGPILHAINVNNITTNPGYVQLHYRHLDLACTRWRRRPARRRASSCSQLTFCGHDQRAVVAVLRLRQQPDLLRRRHRPPAPDQQRASARRRRKRAAGRSPAPRPAFQSPMLYANQLVAGNTDGYLYRIDVSVGIADLHRRAAARRRQRRRGRSRWPDLADHRRHQQQDSRHHRDTASRRVQGAGGVQPDVRRRRSAGRGAPFSAPPTPCRPSSRRSTTTSGEQRRQHLRGRAPAAPPTRC